MIDNPAQCLHYLLSMLRSERISMLTCFKAYDIRGQLGVELNEDIAYRIGRAYRPLYPWMVASIISKRCQELDNTTSCTGVSGL